LQQCTSADLLFLPGGLKYIRRTSIVGSVMHTTRIFKNGNSQAVRIPADLAYERTDIELEIERTGDEIRIRPVGRSLSGVLSKFARFAPGFMAEGRGDQEQSDRDAL
jgi:antitoxin VapB